MSLQRRPVITDKNPHVEGLQDSHKCIYLPSSMDKNQYLPSYLSQNVLFMVGRQMKLQLECLRIKIRRNYPVPRCTEYNVHSLHRSWSFLCDSETRWLQHIRRSRPRDSQILDFAYFQQEPMSVFNNISFLLNFSTASNQIFRRTWRSSARRRLLPGSWRRTGSRWR